MKLGEIKAAVKFLPFGRIIVFSQLFPFSETSSRVTTGAFRMSIMQRQMATIWVSMGVFEIIAIFGGERFLKTSITSTCTLFRLYLIRRFLNLT